MAQQRSRVALVVGGDDDARAFAGALLEESDLTVVESTSAEEALAYLRNHADEVAFLFADVRLPRSLSGVDLARRPDRRGGGRQGAARGPLHAETLAGARRPHGGGAGDRPGALSRQNRAGHASAL